MTARETAWTERKQIGDVLEARVADELRARGWSVSPWGQGVLDGAVRDALRRTDSWARWTPDLVAARGQNVCFIDCKGQMTGRASRRHAIERAAVRAHLQLVAWSNLPIYYVFDDLGVATPYDVLTVAEPGPTPRCGSGAPYFLISSELDRPFDSVFGRPGGPVVSRAA
jgi:hypothetical protein